MQGWAKRLQAQGKPKKIILVAIMRKLALALYHVGVKGEAFEAKRLFARAEQAVGSSAAGAPRS